MNTSTKVHPTETPIDAIAVVDNPRRRFDEEKLQQLSDSIASHGLMHPVVVREITEQDHAAWASAAQMTAEQAAAARNGHRYELIAGERRLRAFRLLELGAIPVRVLDVDAEGAAELRLVENIQREDLHPLDEADAFERLRHQHAWTIEELAARAGRSDRYVRDRLILRKLVKAPQDAFLEGRLQLGHALLLARLDPETQAEALKSATTDWQGKRLADGPSVAQLRDEIRRLMRRLKDAPFDPSDASLVPSAGACAGCPFRTGAAPGLFPEVDDEDTCTSPGCFESKVTAAIERAIGEGVTAVAGSRGEKAPLAKKCEAAPFGSWIEVGRGSKKCLDTVDAIQVSGNWGLGRRMRVCLASKCSTHRPGGTTRSPHDRARDAIHRERSRRLAYVRDAAMEQVVDALASGPHAHRTLFDLAVHSLRDTARDRLEKYLQLDEETELVDASAGLTDAQRLRAVLAGLIYHRIELDPDAFDQLASDSAVDLSPLFEEAAAQKKRRVVLPEDVLGSPFPELARKGESKRSWDDRPWHVLKPGTKATALCKLRIKGPNEQRRRGFPGQHREGVCAKCETAVESLVRAEEERRKA